MANANNIGKNTFIQKSKNHNKINSFMRLPKIEENQNELKNDYFKVIMNKPGGKGKGEKITYDWQSAEVSLISSLPDDDGALNPLIQMQNIALKKQIPHFYTYFFVGKLLLLFQNEKKQAQNKINDLNQKLDNETSSWHKIITLIKLRENLIGKIEKNPQKKKIHELLDDVRFVNFEIVKKITEWKNQHKTTQSSPVFLVEGNNYIVKMINDNASILKSLNDKRNLYLSPPNPFFLSCDGNKGGMSSTQQTQIEECMEVMAQEKAEELRVMMEPPKYVFRTKNSTYELNNLKSQLEADKNEQIKSIYKQQNQSSYSARSMRKSISGFDEKKKKDDKHKKSTSNMKESNYNLEKMIRQKQVKTLKESRLSSSPKIKEKSSKNIYEERINSLKKNVQLKTQAGKKNDQKLAVLKLSQTQKKEESLPKKLTEVKTQKPKIKLVMEKESFVEETIKALLPSKNLQMYQSSQVRKSSSGSFFKPILQKNEEQKQEQKSLMPVTLSSKRKSAINFGSNSLLSTQKLGKQSKYNLQFSRKNKGSQKKNKSLSQSQSLSKSPQKPRFEKQINKKQKTKEEEERDRVDKELRLVKNRLKDLTVMQIYENKMKLKHTNKSPYSRMKQRTSISDAERSLQNPHQNTKQEQLRRLNNLVKEKNIRNIYSYREKPKVVQKSHIKKTEERQEKDAKRQSKYSKKDFKNTKQKFHTNSLKEKGDKIKKENQLKTQQIRKKQQEKEALLKDLAEKDKRISNLLQLLKKEENREQKVQSQFQSQMKKYESQKESKMKQIEQMRTKLSVQNQIIEKQMEQEESRYVALKQEEFRMKQEEVMKKYAKDMQEMKEEYLKRNKELQEKIMEEERLRKQNELKIMKEQRQMEQLRLQLQERNLKERLLAEVMEEQKMKEKLEVEEETQNNQLQRQRLKLEIIQKQEIERKILDNFEQDNKKLIELFEVMKKKNQLIEQQNKRKMKEIQQMEIQMQEQEENLKKFEESLKYSTLYEEQNKKTFVEDPIEEKQKEEDIDIEALKMKVKQEILEEMMKKQLEEEEENKMYEEQRLKKLAEIEDEIKNMLRQREEEMENKEKKEKEEKLQRLKKIQDERKNESERNKSEEQLKYEEQLRKMKQSLERSFHNEEKQEEKNDSQYQKQKKKQEKIQKNEEQSDSKKKEKDEQKQKQEKKQKEKEKQEEKEEKQEKQDKQDKQEKQEKQEKQIDGVNEKKEGQKIVTVEEKKKEEIYQKQKQNLQQKNEEQNIQKQEAKFDENSKKQQKSSDLKENDGSSEKQKQKTDKEQEKDSEKKKELQKSQKSQAKKQEKKQEKIELKSEVKKAVKQQSEQVLNKFQQLQQYIQPKCKQIQIYQNNLENYVENFYNSFSTEVKEMLPYSKNELVEIVSDANKKVDIFDCQAIGWKQEEKYVLVGDIGCIGLIAKKYGNIQVESVYIFNKTNPYQKQHLAKQIKIYDKVGYVFQKKLKQENIFSIKLIIKIPIEILPKNHKPQTNYVTMSNKLMIENHHSEEKMKKYTVSYILSQTLKNNLGGEEELQYKSETGHEEKSIINKMHLGLVNNQLFNTVEIDDNKTQCNFKASLNYIQTQEYPCFIIKSVQQAGLKQEKIFTSKISDSLSIVVFEHSPDQFNLDVQLDARAKRFETEREVLICVPIWSTTESLKLSSPGPKKYTYSYKFASNLNFGSIINTSIQRQNSKFIKPPFVFSVYESNSSGLLLRPLWGQIVEKHEIINIKR